MNQQETRLKDVAKSCKYLSVILFLTGCIYHSVREEEHKTIILLPYNDFPATVADSLLQQLKTFYPNSFLHPSIPLPAQAWNNARHRYRADSLIRTEKDMFGNDTIVIGLTNRDISTTKGNVADFGIMGLGYQPGKACVISSFRLSKTNSYQQLYKVLLHELGHTQGLPHCPNPSCYMRDAKGHNPIDEEKGFCEKCTKLFSQAGIIHSEKS